MADDMLIAIGEALIDFIPNKTDSEMLSAREQCQPYEQNQHHVCIC